MNKNKEEFKKALILDTVNEISYSPKSIVSRIIYKSLNGNITSFAFDEGQILSEHTAPFDAFVLILDGNAEITINGKLFVLTAGQAIIIPANSSHSLKAPVKFKMLLTMIRN
jgi:quercetin dioxygenase-like cupin family protein